MKHFIFIEKFGCNISLKTLDYYKSFNIILDPNTYPDYKSCAMLVKEQKRKFMGV
jgi:hypothetical protein